MKVTTPAKWKKQEIDLLMKLVPTTSTGTVALRLGRTEKAVEQKIYKLRKAGKIAKSVVADPVPLDEPLADYWKREAQTAQRKLADRERETIAVDLLVDAVKELAPVAYQPPKPRPIVTKKAGGSPQSAVLIFSDTHIGQVIHADQTLGLGGYNFEIFLRRLRQLEQAVFSILNDHTTTRVPEIVVAMLGDMLHGALNHSAEAGQVNTLFTQFYSAGHAIAQFFRNLSTLAPIRIHTAVGNHPRFTNQHKMPTDNRFSNFDFFLYAYVEALLRDVKSVKFDLNKQPFALFDVQGYHFHAGHGDTYRGGDRILGVPNHAIGRNIGATTQNFAAAGKALPHYYLIGHLHRPISLPTAAGEFLVNGGFPGVDGYALASAFNLSKPSQKLFLVHPKFGKAASYDLRLDLGDTTPHGYELPNKFPCV